MIKFNCLIHKETGTVIKYEDWFELYSFEDFIVIGHLEGCWSYKAERAIFNDDFEIIYDSEFTLEELLYLNKVCEDSKEELKTKLNNVIYFECLKVARWKEDNHTIILPINQY